MTAQHQSAPAQADPSWAIPARAGRARRSGFRVLLYSHDTFGLGHLRRTRVLAHAFARRGPDASALIVSGSPLIGSFEFDARVDFVRVPGIIKKRNGAYRSLTLPIAVEETIALRSVLIREATVSFAPDLVVVDKEPAGLRGEMLPALQALKERGVPVVLGVRDVLDEAAPLAREWARKGSADILEAYYDAIWIYGLERFHAPLNGIGLPERLRDAVRYTGYLPRPLDEPLARTDAPFVLVTPGGGGDGAGLIDWVLSAYEQDPTLTIKAKLVLGPFMEPQTRARLLARAAKLDPVEATVFDPHINQSLAQASGVIAMGGYNTFCEILTHDKPALLVPRVRPRREQWIRAQRADALGLAKLMEDPLETRGERRDPAQMAQALRMLRTQPPPSQAAMTDLLDGFKTIDTWLDERFGPATGTGEAAP